MADDGAAPKRFLLPTHVVPKNYDVTLTPDLAAFTFEGICRIDLDVKDATRTIVLNASELKFTSVKVTQGGRVEAVEEGRWAMDDVHERATITLGEELKARRTAVLEVTYEGTLNDQMRGFYRSKYTRKLDDGTEEERYMASTQFEAVDARRALPCWDEPLLKATFDVALVVPDHLTAISNMHETTTSRNAAARTKTVAFARTPPMSTYLLAFIVGELEHVERTIQKAVSGEDTLIRVYTVPGMKHQADFALDVAAKCLTLYERFFNLDYPLAKCDLVAIPDFACGAMENWGLITYRETALLCDATSSLRTRMWVALVVCHELAHQWFGNLVTMEWWRELWLNESFATYMEFDCVDKLFPQWQPWATFVSEDYDSALTLDALLSSHPVEVDVEHAAEIDEIFDDISYAKGCSLMRMVTSWIGDDAFRAAMQAYMKKFAYANATTVDLWAHLEAASKLPVAEVMSVWTEQQGYPVLTAKRLPTGDVEVTQSRFLSNGLPTPEQDAQVWQIPIVVGTDRGVQKHLVQGRTCVLPVDKAAAWVKLNYGQTSLVRVHYDASILNGVVAAIQSGSLSNVDVSGILLDLAALVKAGRAPAVDLLRIASSFADLADQDDCTVWSAVKYALGEVEHIVRDDDAAMAALSGFMQRVFAGLGRRLGWDHASTDDDRRRQLRGIAIGVLAGHGDAAYVAEARARFAKFHATKDDATLPADLRAGVYHSTVRHDPTADTWEQLRAMYESAADPTEKSRCLRALAATADPALLQRTLDYAGGSEKVRNQDAPSLMGAIAANRKGTQLFNTHVMENWEALYARFNGGVMTSTLCAYLSNPVDDASLAALEAWWAKVDAEQRKCAERVMGQTLETIRVYIGFKQRDFDAAVAWLNDYNAKH